MAKWTYERQKEHVARKNRELSLTGRDIGPLPKVKNPKRKAKCSRDFKAFCETYFPEVFSLAWSESHLVALKRMETAVLNGGRFALAFPRGGGKTSLAKRCVEWATLYGHKSFPVLIGATQEKAVELLEDIRNDLENNKLLAADFPEVCYPIQQLEGITKRQAGQLLNGCRTNIRILKNQLVLPTVTKSKASGARIKVSGIEGSIRGMLATLPDGTPIRPDLVVVDDPQTEESAYSPQQIQRRLKVINGAIIGLAGPKKKLSILMPITVIANGDVADQLLDKQKHPDWQGERVKLLKTLPTNLKLWEEYGELRGKAMRDTGTITAATEFYRINRVAMDAGAEAGWTARYNDDELSAIQHGMNLKLIDEESFYSEYQNEPVTLRADTLITITPEQVQKKVYALPRFSIPDDAQKLTGFIDVQKDILFYSVYASGEEFTGAVVDYGTYPEQARNYFNLREIAPTIAADTGLAALEAQLYEGLRRLSTRLLSRDWERQSGGTQRISRLVIDSGYQDGIVKQFCRESQYSALLIPSKGYGITADRMPMGEWKINTGERVGWNWRIRLSPDRHLIYDTNSWKTFIAARLASNPGDKGNISLFDGSPAQHRLFAEHLASEIGTPVESMGRTVNVWGKKPNRDNHYLDCIVGAAVAASEQGISFVGHTKHQAVRARKRGATMKV